MSFILGLGDRRRDAELGELRHACRLLRRPPPPAEAAQRDLADRRRNRLLDR